MFAVRVVYQDTNEYLAENGVVKLFKTMKEAEEYVKSSPTLPNSQVKIVNFLVD